MRKIILASFVTLIIGFLLLIFQPKVASVLDSKSGETHTITLTSDGFVPNSITIKKGDTIIVRTTAGKHFWPASDIHPTHGIYPEFDPQDAIAPNKTWSFKFEKIGKWRFHDHLAPYFTGTIIVEK